MTHLLASSPRMIRALLGPVRPKLLTLRTRMVMLVIGDSSWPERLLLHSPIRCTATSRRQLARGGRAGTDARRTQPAPPPLTHLDHANKAPVQVWAFLLQFCAEQERARCIG